MNENQPDTEKTGNRHFDPELLKKGLRCDLEQYDMLKRCSDKKDMTEWNQWREENPGEDPLLEGAELNDSNLEGAWLWHAHLAVAKLERARMEGASLDRAHLGRAVMFDAHLEGANLSYVDAKYVKLSNANLEGSDLSYADLERANFNYAKMKGVHISDAILKNAVLRCVELEDTYLGYGHFEGADFSKANLKDADLSHSHLEGAKLDETNLENAKLQYARLEHARFWKANLACAHLWRAHLEGAYLGEANIQHADLTDADLRGTNIWRANIMAATYKTAVVDGSTLLWKCKVDPNTDFRGVGLDSCRIDPGTKQLLEYNIRRKNWEEWYKEHKFLHRPVWLFWSFSDYGRSTWRIIAWFFGLALAFAIIYSLFPGCVKVYDNVGDIRGFWHALYFSVVTMTTLGFGDIAANPDSWLGQTLLMIQVILGYVLLGALVTRFAVLFTAGGPAGKFADEKTLFDRLKQLRTKPKGKNVERS